MASLTPFDPFFRFDISDQNQPGIGLRQTLMPYYADAQALRQSGQGPAADILLADLHETDSAFVITCDLPGVNKSDLDITIRDDVLQIKAERKHIPRLDSDVLHHRERNFGTVCRSIAMPQGVNLDAASVDFQGGVLSITLPKMVSSSPSGRKLKIAGKK